MAFSLPLDSLRATAERFLPDTASIQRATVVSTGDGQATEWATVATVACRVSPLGNAAREALVAGGIQADAQYVVTVPVGTDVTSADRLVVGSRTFEVVEPSERSYAVSLRLICRELG